MLRSHRGGSALLADPLLAGALDPERNAPHTTWAVEGDEGLLGAASGWIDGDCGWFAVWMSPSARRQGHGLSLSEAVVGWLRSNGASQIDSISLPGDRATKQLLEKMGFKARLLIMRTGG
jgi:GNAT superfamily N-acetyltransferase